MRLGLNLFVLDVCSVVMASEPAPDLTIEQATELSHQIETEQELAHLFAVVENKAKWLDDACYDFEVDSPEHKKARAISDSWFSLAKKLQGRICDILISEGVEIPDKGKIVVLRPFMERNGFRDGNGWWIREEKTHAIR